MRKTANDATVIIESSTAGAWTTYKSPNYYAGALYNINGVEQYAVGLLQGADRWTIRKGRSGAEMFTVLPGGNVGIGTDSPAQKLEVVGRVKATGLDVDVPDGGGSPATTAIIKIHGYEGRGAGIQIRDSVNSAASASNREWFVGSGYNGSHFNIGYAADGVQSSYTAQSKLIIAASTGNVGIGTSSPTAKLQISHNGGHTSGNVALANASLDLYNPLAADTDETGSVLTFSANYFGGGTSYPRTTSAAIKGGTDPVGNTADGFLCFLYRLWWCTFNARCVCELIMTGNVRYRISCSSRQACTFETEAFSYSKKVLEQDIRK